MRREKWEGHSSVCGIYNNSYFKIYREVMLQNLGIVIEFITYSSVGQGFNMILTFNSLVHLSFVMNKYAAFLNEIMHKCSVHVENL